MSHESKTANYLLLGFSVVSLVLLSLPLTGKVRSFRALASYLFHPVPYTGSAAVERFSTIPEDAVRLIQADIRIREAENKLVEAELLESERDSLLREVQRLRKALGLSPASGRVVRWARVMERNPVNWNRSIMISAGSDHGVKINAAVLGVEKGGLGVVGRVVEVRPQVSKVLLLTDESSSVAAYLPNRHWEGLVEGDGSFKLRMNYLPEEAQFEVGQRVLTSPTSVVFPEGLLVGTVSRVFARDPFLAYQAIEVTPAVSASRLQEVMLLEPVPERREPDEEKAPSVKEDGA